MTPFSLQHNQEDARDRPTVIVIWTKEGEGVLWI
jgi:hypothetical protein